MSPDLFNTSISGQLGHVGKQAQPRTLLLLLLLLLR